MGFFDVNMITHRVSPQQARYTPMGGREKCARCRFFIAPKWCGHVTGPVSPMGWCKYFSQEMRAQFGGSQAVAIGPPGATLDLGFMTPGIMTAGITFTRASTATYTDASGAIQPAAINQPRWDYTGGSLRGLLIEEGRTNLSFPSTNWLAGSVPGGSVDGITQNVGAGLSGVNNAMALIPGAFSGVHQFFTTFGGAPSTTYTYSLYAKPAGMSFLYMELGNTGFTATGQTGIFNLSAGIVDSQTAGAAARIQSIGGGWFRCSIVATSSAGGGVYLTNLRPGADGTIGFAVSTGNNVNGVWVWGQQVETGTFPTSYIPTTSGEVARQIDICTISPANMSPWFASPGGTWFAEFVNFDAAMTGKNSRVIGPTAAGSNSPMYEAASLVMVQFDGGFCATANTVTANAIVKVASGWSPGLAKLCLNGGPVAAAALATGYAGLVTNGVTLFGTVPASFSEQMSGYLRRVQYWPRALTDAEMQQVTT
jgi:hypothetical protein